MGHAVVGTANPTLTNYTAHSIHDAWNQFTQSDRDGSYHDYVRSLSSARRFECFFNGAVLTLVGPKRKFVVSKSSRLCLDDSSLSPCVGITMPTDMGHRLRRSSE